MISNINIKGVNYSVGGDNKAKLVARGTRKPEEHKNFYLDKALEKNKFYYVRLFYVDGGYEFNTILLVALDGYYNPRSPINIIDDAEIDYCPSNCYYSYWNNEPCIEISTGDFMTFLEYEDIETYIEVYELPFTLGGNE